MSETTENQKETTNELKEMCHCENDLSKVQLANEYNLPMVDGGLIWPETYYWQNMVLAYYQMFNAGLYNGDANMMADGLPTLNHMATSYNTEEANSNYG